MIAKAREKTRPQKPQKPQKPLRVDAERNRRRVLEVAESVFADAGVNAPIDEIAKRAGLGVGTLYRHFPTKEALIAAIVTMRVEESIERIREALENECSGEEFFSFLRKMIDGWRQKKDFMEAMSRAGVDMRPIARVKEVFHDELAKLLERAQDDGAVRPGVSVHEVLAVVSGTIMSIDRPEISADGRERVLAILFDGLRPPVIPAAIVRAPVRKPRARAS